MKQAIDEFVKLSKQVHKMCMDAVIDWKCIHSFKLDGSLSMKYYHGEGFHYYQVIIHDEALEMMLFSNFDSTVNISILIDAIDIELYCDAMRELIAHRLHDELGAIQKDPIKALRIKELENELKQLKHE